MVVSSIPPPTEVNEPQWRDLALYTSATHEQYCATHGYDYKMDVSDVWRQARSPWRGDPNQGHQAPIRTMVKFPLLLHYLTPEACKVEYDWCVWLDADVLITNYERRLEEFFNQEGAASGEGPFLGDLILAEDVNGLHPTVIMVRASRLTRGLISACGGSASMAMFMQHDWSDIMAFRFFLATPPYSGLVWYHSAQTLCAWHPNTYTDHPRDVQKAYEWTEQSLALHLSALPLGDVVKDGKLVRKGRITLAKEYCERLGLLEAPRAEALR